MKKNTLLILALQQYALPAKACHQTHAKLFIFCALLLVKKAQASSWTLDFQKYSLTYKGYKCVMKKTV